jgi:hypothetical protein
MQKIINPTGAGVAEPSLSARTVTRELFFAAKISADVLKLKASANPSALIVLVIFILPLPDL